MSVAIETPPGAPAYPSELASTLAAAVTARLRTEKPRTHHLHPDGSPRWTNRLALETSPYLLQHAHNPVDWRPWGPEAFAEAERTNRPVFLSVGYSTCHWCHVMEVESFEDPEIAQVLNERFVAIKVDREERPDVDAVYMQAVQLLTQHGGWPMSVFLTPDRKPFYGGTYFPARDGDRGARIGFRTILIELARVYAQERERAVASAEEIARAVRRSLTAETPTDLPGNAVVHAAMRAYEQSFDAREGGMRRAPKFPSSLPVRFLLRYSRRTGDGAALRMAELSLTKMALGGLYDQVGGGFHRYSTDAQWLVPHFEKMLYDNALLVPAYVEAHQATGNPFFRRVALDVLDFVAREMTDPNGAFWSATDADSEGEEGTFFVWTRAEFEAALGPEDGARAAALYDVTVAGNFEGKNVLHLAQVPGADDQAFLDAIRPRLAAARARREPPLTDRKVIASWNGLMISAFARAGLAFDRPDLVEKAARAAQTLLAVHAAPDGAGLLRTSLASVARHPGLLEDHAFVAAGLVDLFEASGDPRWLREALRLHEVLAARFADPNGGFFRTPAGHEELLAREKPGQDGAEPNGNSVAALTLLRLAALTGDAGLRAQAEGVLRACGATLAAVPVALGEMLLAVDWLLEEPREVVLVRPRGGNDAALLGALRAGFHPSHVLVRVEEGGQDARGPDALGQLTSLASGRGTTAGVATAYVCSGGACQLPVTDPAALEKLLQAD